MKNSINLKKLVLLLGDVLIMYLALFLTLLVRYREIPDARLWQIHLTAFSLIFIFWLLIFYIANLYDLRIAINNQRFWQLIGRSVLIAGLFSMALFYLLPPNGITPKTNLIIFIAIFSLLFSTWRQFYNWSLKSYLPKNNIAIIGMNNEVTELIQELHNRPHLGYRVSFIVDNKRNENFEGTKVVNDYGKLEEMIRSEKINSVIISSDLHESEDLRNVLFACLPLKLSYYSLPIFYEAVTGKVPINVITQMWFLENLNEGNKTLFDKSKYIFDLISALLLFIVSLIFWPIIALIIKFESKGPIFFTQVRSGKDGEPFKIIKFRTMTVSDNDFSPTKEHDVRVTKFGSFLRKSRIDEIPQLINIIRGEMSFVGPRPERPELIKELEQFVPFYRERMLVKPGVTGWDQVSGEYHSPSKEDTLKKLQYDLFYIKNRSLYLDFSIILKTFYTVLSKSGR